MRKIVLFLLIITIATTYICFSTASAQDAVDMPDEDVITQPEEIESVDSFEADLEPMVEESSEELTTNTMEEVTSQEPLTEEEPAEELPEEKFIEAVGRPCPVIKLWPEGQVPDEPKPVRAEQFTTEDPGRNRKGILRISNVFDPSFIVVAPTAGAPFEHRARLLSSGCGVISRDRCQRHAAEENTNREREQKNSLCHHDPTLLKILRRSPRWPQE